MIAGFDIEENDARDDIVIEESDDEEEEQAPIDLRAWTTNDLGSYFACVVIDHLYHPMEQGFEISELNLSAGAKRGSQVIRCEDDDLVIYQSKIPYFTCRGNHFINFNERKTFPLSAFEMNNSNTKLYIF